MKTPNTMRPAEGPQAQVSRRAWQAALVACLLLGAVLRLHAIGQKSLWVDEASIYYLADRPLPQVVVEASLTEAHPPLYPLLLSVWSHFGSSEGWLRSLSVLASVAAVAAAAALARRLYDARAGILAGVLAATSAYQVYFAQEMRFHALSILLAGAAAIALDSALRGKGWVRWAMWTAASTLLLYTYLYGALVIAALTLAALLTARGRRRWKGLLVSGIVTTLAFLPWLEVVLARARLAEQAAQAIRPGPMPGDLLATLVRFSFGFLQEDTAALWMLSVPVAALLAWSLARSTRPVSTLLAVALFLPPAAVLAMPWKIHVYEPRHLVLLTPFFFAALAGGLTRIRASLLRRAMTIFLIAGNAASLMVYYRPELVKEDWRQAAGIVAARAATEDVILFSPDYCGFAFDYYYRGQHRRSGVDSAALRGGIESIASHNPRIWLVENHSLTSLPRATARNTLSRTHIPGEAAVLPGMKGLIRVTLYERRDLSPAADVHH